MNRAATPTPARLVLEDGSVFAGRAFGHRAVGAGEVVFTTGMVGYPESLTDPSYRRQILVFTYPLIGNYGVPPEQRDGYGLPLGVESDKIHVSGVVVLEEATHFCHRSSSRTLDEWLRGHSVPGLSGVDTRALTKRLRERGTMLGRIESGDEPPSEGGWQDPNIFDLAAEVTIREPIRYDVDPDGPTVLLVDCGCKASIIRCLLARRMNVLRVPYDYYFINESYDGLVVSNGPGDPNTYQATIRNLERALALGKPTLGICLGNQLLALAVGAETYKLKFGHRSQNQPCLELVGRSANDSVRRCVITSQNHGFAVREASLPRDWRVWFRNANDGTVEGIRHVARPLAAIQFHPEAAPGPVDSAWVFDDFAAQVQKGSHRMVTA